MSAATGSVEDASASQQDTPPVRGGSTTSSGGRGSVSGSSSFHSADTGANLVDPITLDMLPQSFPLVYADASVCIQGHRYYKSIGAPVRLRRSPPLDSDLKLVIESWFPGNIYERLIRGMGIYDIETYVKFFNQSGYKDMLFALSYRYYILQEVEPDFDADVDPLLMSLMLATELERQEDPLTVPALAADMYKNEVLDDYHERFSNPSAMLPYQEARQLLSDHVLSLANCIRPILERIPEDQGRRQPPLSTASSSIGTAPPLPRRLQERYGRPSTYIDHPDEASSPIRPSTSPSQSRVTFAGPPSVVPAPRDRLGPQPVDPLTPRFHDNFQDTYAIPDTERFSFPVNAVPPQERGVLDSDPNLGPHALNIDPDDPGAFMGRVRQHEQNDAANVISSGVRHPPSTWTRSTKPARLSLKEFTRWDGRPASYTPTMDRAWVNMRVVGLGYLRDRNILKLFLQLDYACVRHPDCAHYVLHYDLNERQLMLLDQQLFGVLEYIFGDGAASLFLSSDGEPLEGRQVSGMRQYLRLEERYANGQSLASSVVYYQQLLHQPYDGSPMHRYIPNRALMEKLYNRLAKKISEGSGLPPSIHNDITKVASLAQSLRSSTAHLPNKQLILEKLEMDFSKNFTRACDYVLTKVANDMLGDTLARPGPPSPRAVNYAHQPDALTALQELDKANVTVSDDERQALNVAQGVAARANVIAPHIWKLMPAEAQQGFIDARKKAESETPSSQQGGTPLPKQYGRNANVAERSFTNLEEDPDEDGERNEIEAWHQEFMEDYYTKDDAIAEIEAQVNNAHRQRQRRFQAPTFGISGDRFANIARNVMMSRSVWMDGQASRIRSEMVWNEMERRINTNANEFTSDGRKKGICIVDRGADSCITNGGAWIHEYPTMDLKVTLKGPVNMTKTGLYVAQRSVVKTLLENGEWVLLAVNWGITNSRQKHRQQKSETAGASILSSFQMGCNNQVCVDDTPRNQWRTTFGQKGKQRIFLDVKNPKIAIKLEVRGGLMVFPFEEPTKDDLTDLRCFDVTPRTDVPWNPQEYYDNELEDSLDESANAPSNGPTFHDRPQVMQVNQEIPKVVLPKDRKREDDIVEDDVSMDDSWEEDGNEVTVDAQMGIDGDDGVTIRSGPHHGSAFTVVEPLLDDDDLSPYYFDPTDELADDGISDITDENVRHSFQLTLDPVTVASMTEPEEVIESYRLMVDEGDWFNLDDVASSMNDEFSYVNHYYEPSIDRFDDDPDDVFNRRRESMAQMFQLRFAREMESDQDTSEVGSFLSQLSLEELTGHHDRFDTFAFGVRSANVFRSHQHKISDEDAEEYRPYLGYRPLRVIKKTFAATTQLAKAVQSHVLTRHQQKRFPWHTTIMRLSETISTDPLFANVVAFGGEIGAQVFWGKMSHMINVYGIRRESDFPRVYQEFIRDQGIPHTLLRDNAKTQHSEKVRDIHLRYNIKDAFSEPMNQWQNLVESQAIKYLKQATRILLDRTGAPEYLWLLAMCYLAEIHNLCASESLGWKTPKTVRFGRTFDISAYLEYQFYERVYYLEFESTFPESRELAGYWVGVAENVGDALTYYILTEDHQSVVARSVLRHANDPKNPNKRVFRTDESSVDAVAGATAKQTKTSTTNATISPSTAPPVEVPRVEFHPKPLKRRQVTRVPVKQRTRKHKLRRPHPHPELVQAAETKPSDRQADPLDSGGSLLPSPDDIKDPPIVKAQRSSQEEVIDEVEQEPSEEALEEAKLEEPKVDITTAETKDKEPQRRSARLFQRNLKAKVMTMAAAMVANHTVGATMGTPRSFVLHTALETQTDSTTTASGPPFMEIFEDTSLDSFSDKEFDRFVGLTQMDSLNDWPDGGASDWTILAIEDHRTMNQMMRIKNLDENGKLDKDKPYNVLPKKHLRYKVRYRNGEVKWAQANAVNLDDPFVAVQYAYKRGLEKNPAFKWTQKYARDENKLNEARERFVRTATKAPKYKFGVEVPRSIKHALQLDKLNGNNLWKEAIEKELSQINEYKTFKSVKDGVRIPSDYKRIPYHFVFDVKVDLRRKARLVAGGNWCDPPKEDIYSGVVGMDTIRLAFTLAAMNDLKVCAADVGNAFLYGKTNEKVFVIAGPEFGPAVQGKRLIIDKGLYGLRSSSARFHSHCAAKLKSMGFKPSKPDADLWIRDKGDHYEYLATYVDDILVFSRDPMPVIEELKKTYILKGVGIPEYYLGGDIEEIKDDRKLENSENETPIQTALSAKTYIKNVTPKLERIAECTFRKANTPMEESYHPESDESELLDEKGQSLYRAIIGSANWLVTLGRFDLQYATNTLARFSHAPRLGHMLQAQRIFGYLKKDYTRKGRILIDPNFHQPHSDLKFEQYDNWKEFYPDAGDELPPNMPEARGAKAKVTVYVDADHAHCTLTRRSVTGIILFVNNTPIKFISKMQKTVETSTYGSELVASRIAVDLAIEYRYTLRMLGVPIDGPVRMYGDNNAVVLNTTLPSSQLKKKHCAIAYHRVREAMAAGIIEFFHVPSEENVADILTKPLGNQAFHRLAAPLLFRGLTKWKDGNASMKSGVSDRK